MSRLSESIRRISSPTTFTPKDAFVGALGISLVIFEVFGPLVGYPTVTGLLYVGFQVDPNAIVIWQLALVLIPQLGAGYIGGKALAKSPWGRWVSGPLKRERNMLLPEVHLRHTGLGALTAFVPWLLLVLQLGQLPAQRIP